MGKVVWATDLHLDWASEAQKEAFYESVLAQTPDAVLLTGDIAEGANTPLYLEQMAHRLARPIYFVLGNHDFYGDSIRRVRSRIAALTRKIPQLRYLSFSEVVALGQQTALIGHDGWGDGRWGDYWQSRVFLTDFVAIKELATVYQDRRAMLAQLQRLGDQSARYLRTRLTEALAAFPNVVVLTHVPPFREAAWYEGRPSDDQWLPFFTCEAVGRMLGEVMQKHPECHLLVLCGHTHGGAEVQILKNLQVLCGAAEGTGPIVQRTLWVE